MKVDFEKLEEKINQLKMELIQVVEATGLDSYDALYCSQELDKHITIYQQSVYSSLKTATK